MEATTGASLEYVPLRADAEARRGLPNSSGWPIDPPLLGDEALAVIATLARGLAVSWGCP